MPSRRPRTYLRRVVLGRPHLAIGAAVGIVAYLIESSAWAQATRMLIAWNVGTLIYLSLTCYVMAWATPHTIRRRAAETDEGRIAILVFTSLAAVAAMSAIVVELGLAKNLHGIAKGMQIGLVGLTILSAWSFIHVSFALHYAHEFFDPPPDEPGERRKVKGGIRFPETDEPDYWDFLYFSFIIGVATQTADVSITSRAIRRTSLAHSLLAFVFNSAILALTINIAAGLV